MGAYGKTGNQLKGWGYIKWPNVSELSRFICSWEVIKWRTATGHAMAQAIRY
jgi:hypothetical protein